MDLNLLVTRWRICLEPKILEGIVLNNLCQLKCSCITP
jgi:hypothetical protein